MRSKSKEERSDFSRIEDVMEIPDLLAVQTQSYGDFLQADILPERRKHQGLQAVFKEIFPILSYDCKEENGKILNGLRLNFVGYSLGVPKYDEEECKRRGLTLSASLKVQLRLHDPSGIKEEWVYMGSLPIMTRRGTFIINGAERVTVSQLHRSPGIFFEEEIHPRGTVLYSFRIIPYRGSWLEGSFDVNDCVHIYLDRKRRRRKIMATTLLRAIGFGTPEEILAQFFEPEEADLSKRVSESALLGRVIASNVVQDETGLLLAKAGAPMTLETLNHLKEARVRRVTFCRDATESHPIVKMLQRDGVLDQDEALKEIYKKLRPGDPATVQNARALIKRLLFDPKRYDLGRVGRYKLNHKLGLPLNEKEFAVTTLKKEDIVASLRYLIRLREGDPQCTTDDIDHLGNRRIRTVGELLQNQCRIGMARMEKLIKERMNLYDMSSDTITPHRLINPKALSSVVRDFFGRSQLSQFMDQTNPLAELTHKRRLSALGPGGLSRERAGFEVRDVHPSHYGRICPIETPEGPNIGLISSLSTYARINEYGFLETPYLVVKKGKVTREILYLTADDEETYWIAQANAPLGKDGRFLAEKVSVRYRGDFLEVVPETVQLMDISPKQLVSMAAGLIPFLEHDDANRALMGSNMQRQAVPLLTTEAPIVATGLEGKAARDSRVLVLSEEDGEVIFADAARIVVKGKSGQEREYPLTKYARSNAGTCLNQRPLVRKGQRVKKGSVLADGPATRDGEISLGRNVMVAFMPWGGFNFEDAILINERLLKEDIFTSIHIEEFEAGARDTKLGREEITRDIPNVGEEALKDLDNEGIVLVGAEVKPGDILVGKITPKSETELTPEERLLRAIFGQKAADVRDTSLTVPSGTEGIVMDVRVFARKDMTQDQEEEQEERRYLKEINEEYKEAVARKREERFRRISEFLVGIKLDEDIVNIQTGEVLIPAGKKVTKEQVRKLELMDYSDIEISDSPLHLDLKKVVLKFEHEFEEMEMEKTRRVESIKKGDELEPGVIKQVKVYVASKRKLSVGDKMAGRHGNKGVIAKILPEEDMPFLEDGTPVEIVLNPLGVPSRMNVGQILETHLGWAARILGMKVSTPVFDGIREEKILELLGEAGLPETGKVTLFDGRTGEPFDQPVTVGYIYIMKLSHLVADKIHARATGPYSLVTQQPLGGKAQFGGQRFGEMEVWAMEAYGASYALQEILTVKSDDVMGRTKIYESIVKGDNTLQAGTPESFNVLIKEMQSLCLDVRVEG